MTDVRPASLRPAAEPPASSSRIKTGIVMMNLGGPATLDDVEPFLLELFADREIIQLPFQRWLGPPPNAQGAEPLREHRGRLAHPAIHRGAG
jgi:hypothetical protein